MVKPALRPRNLGAGTEGTDMDLMMILATLAVVYGAVMTVVVAAKWKE